MNLLHSCAQLMPATFTWIQRHRVRIIDGETALEGVVLFGVLIAVVILYKFLRKQLKP